MESPDKDLTIKSITAVPRSKNFYNFYINGTPEKRSYKLEKLANLITGLCPIVGGKARIMIYEFRPFYVEIETQTILELAENPGRRETHRETVFEGIGNVLKETKKGRNDTFIDNLRGKVYSNILKLVK